ncbi:MAG: phosphoglucomutase/phosphomannomutase family protein [Planctomycetia bacterium]|nr:phosphoglucomutase/phosphomannomutase family protein [Planctomycetia bacterium]
MIRFGTGGWRAEIGKDFNMENIGLIAQGLSDYINERGDAGKPVVIGYDRRFLSDVSARWLAETLCANGISVLFMHRSAPTPLVMHTVKKQELNYGLEVTASHNPSTYNGVKVIVREGRDAPLEVTGAIEEHIAALKPENVKRLDFGDCAESGKIIFLKNPYNDFLDDILAVIDTGIIRERGPRILFDPMHGSAAYPLMAVFYTARCTLDQIHGDKDAYFGGLMPAPTESTLGELRTRVVSGGYDLGIGVDGDGDRLGIIDSNGRYINANEILVLLYYYLHEYKGWRGAVVRNVATTHLLDKVARSFGEQCYEVPVGFKYISAEIDAVDAVLGGESSGGLTVRGHIHGKDSVYAASLFTEMICRTGKTATELLGEIKDKFGSFEMVEENLLFRPDDKPRLMKIIMEERLLPEFEPAVGAVSYQDGCKVYFADGSFVICRFSGTEPLIRIFAEAEARERALEYIAAWRGFLGI